MATNFISSDASTPTAAPIFGSSSIHYIGDDQNYDSDSSLSDICSIDSSDSDSEDENSNGEPNPEDEDNDNEPDKCLISLLATGGDLPDWPVKRSDGKLYIVLTVVLRGGDTGGLHTVRRVFSGPYSSAKTANSHTMSHISEYLVPDEIREMAEYESVINTMEDIVENWEDTYEREIDELNKVGGLYDSGIIRPGEYGIKNHLEDADVYSYRIHVQRDGEIEFQEIPKDVEQGFEAALAKLTLEAEGRDEDQSMESL